MADVTVGVRGDSRKFTMPTTRRIAESSFSIREPRRNRLRVRAATEPRPTLGARASHEAITPCKSFPDGRNEVVAFCETSPEAPRRRLHRRRGEALIDESRRNRFHQCPPQLNGSFMSRANPRASASRLAEGSGVALICELSKPVTTTFETLKSRCVPLGQPVEGGLH
jgi:hypothetical protein